VSCIGFVGLAIPSFLPDVLPAVEIGWRLARDWWGRGAATEAATAVLEDAFDGVGLDRVISIRHADNTASGRVMDKLGLRHDHDAIVPATGVACSVYSLTKEQWLTARR
jgi:RimJ/RimL family protein N-acetyltransferase